jgi:hypothetical protein
MEIFYLKKCVNTQISIIHGTVFSVRQIPSYSEKVDASCKEKDWYLENACAFQWVKVEVGWEKIVSRGRYGKKKI